MKAQPLPFQVFGNKERVHILCCLKEKMTVTELLARCSNLSQSALSQHLQVLRTARLVHTTRSGKYRYYALQNSDTLKIAQSLLTFNLPTI